LGKQIAMLILFCLIRELAAQQLQRKDNNSMGHSHLEKNSCGCGAQVKKNRSEPFG